MDWDEYKKSKNLASSNTLSLTNRSISRPRVEEVTISDRCKHCKGKYPGLDFHEECCYYNPANDYPYNETSANRVEEVSVQTPANHQEVNMQTPVN